MALSTNAYSLLVAKIKTVWSLGDDDVIRASSLNILNIEERLRASNIDTPFCILVLWEDREADYGGNNQTYETSISAFYVIERTTSDSADLIETACESLKTELYGWFDSNGTGSVQVLKSPIKNCDVNNAFNNRCLELGNGLIGGEVKFPLLYGEVP